MKLGIYSLLQPPTLPGESEGPLGSVELSKAIFEQPVRGDILARVVRWQQACRRAGTHASKGISDISGTTRKPFKQKGTGKARQGSLRSPQFRGGAVIFGPQVRSHAYALPKRVRRLGLITALSSKAAEKQVLALDTLAWDAVEAKRHKIVPGKTSMLRSFLKPLGGDVLFISKEKPDMLFVRASRNWPRIHVLPVCGLNVYDVLRYAYVVFEKDALPLLEARLQGVATGEDQSVTKRGKVSAASDRPVGVATAKASSRSSSKTAPKASVSRKKGEI